MKERSISAYLVLAALPLALVLSNLKVYQYASRLSERTYQSNARSEALEMGLRIQNHLAERANDLKVLSEVWRAHREDRNFEHFHEIANGFVAGNGCYHAINYVDAEGIVRVTVPKSNEPALLGRDLKGLPGRIDMHARARTAGHPMVSPPIVLVGEYPGFVMWHPIETNGSETFHGFAAAAIKIEDFVKGVLHETSTHFFALRVSLGDQPIYSSPDAPKAASASLAGIERFEAFGQTWKIEAFFREGTPLSDLGRPALWSLYLGIGLSLLTGILLFRIAHSNRRLSRSQAQTKASEEDLCITLASIGDAVISTDTEGRVRRMNPVAETLTGWSFSEAQGRPLAEVFRIVNALTREPSDNPVERVIEGCAIVGLANHTILLARDGREYQIADSGAPIKADNGATRGVVLVFRDITEEYALQEALRTERELSERLIEDGPVGIVKVNPDGEIVFANRHAERLFGLEMSDIQGRGYNAPDWRITAVDGAPFPDEDLPFRRVMATGRALTDVQHAIVRGDGARRILSINGAPLHDAQGQIEGVVFAILDVTERKQEEKRASRFSHVLENSLNEIYIFDADTLHFVEVNRGARENLGYSMEELRSLTPLDLKPEFTAEMFGELIEPLQTGVEEIVQFNTVHRRKDETQYPVEVHLQLIKGDTPLFVAIILDITKGKQAEEALARSEVRHRVLFEQSRDAIMTLAPPYWLFTSGNPATIQMFGAKDEEDFTSRAPWEYSPETQPDGRPSTDKAKEMIETAMQEGHHFFEWQHQRLSGDVFPATVLLSRIEIDDHVLLQATVRDITDLKRAEKALRRSESLFQAMLAAIPDMISIHDTEMNVVYSNWNGFAAVPPDRRLIGEKCYRIYRGHDKVCPDCRAKQVIETRKPYAEEVELPEGGWYELNVIPILDAEGNCELFVEWVRDITERKATEEALRKSERKFRALVDNTIDWIWETDAYGTYTYASENTHEILGYASEELLGRTPFDFMDNEEADRVRSIFQEIAQKHDRIVELEDTLLHKDGDPVVFSTNATPLFDATGVLLGYFGTCRDITERKQAEAERERLGAQLQQAQKMEAVGRLAGGVAHDFNNMLGVILGHAEIMSDGLPADSLLRDDLDEIRKAAERSANLTRQLLAFARKQTVAPKNLDLNETVASMLKMLQRLIGEDIDLLWKPGAPLDTVRIDPGQVDQMLANLAVNARDAIAHAHGKITIETSNARFDEMYCADHAGFTPGDYVMLAVSDDGRGMDEETRANIFEPFFTTKGVGEGTGLGLATVYGIVKQNNGFVSVYSEPGHGTAFKIYLPALAEVSVGPAGVEAVLDSPDTGNDTILVVEDQPALLKLARNMLERLGYTVLTAATPSEALRVAREQSGRIDLLITDLVMPEMNGRELAEQLQALCPGLKNLFMSGYTTNVIAHQGVLEEDVNFIQKPFSQKDLARKARQALD